MNITKRYRTKLRVLLACAGKLSTLSTCKRDRVGAIVVPVDCSAALAIGYNGPVRGAPNDSCSGQRGRCGCVHAEANALVKLGRTPEPCVLLTTRAPCLYCARLAVNVGCIVAVVYDKVYRSRAGIRLLEKCGIPCLSREELGRGDRAFVEKWRTDSPAGRRAAAAAEGAR